jgi:hypothetical protein
MKYKSPSSVSRTGEGDSVYSYPYNLLGNLKPISGGLPIIEPNTRFIPRRAIICSVGINPNTILIGRTSVYPIPTAGIIICGSRYDALIIAQREVKVITIITIPVLNGIDAIRV